MTASPSKPAVLMDHALRISQWRDRTPQFPSTALKATAAGKAGLSNAEPWFIEANCPDKTGGKAYAFYCLGLRISQTRPRKPASGKRMQAAYLSGWQADLGSIEVYAKKHRLRRSRTGGTMKKANLWNCGMVGGVIPMSAACACAQDWPQW